MNLIVGKSTGIALLLAAAMLAALFAMGVFSATGVGAHGGDEPHDDAAIHLSSGEITVTGGSSLEIVDDQYSYTIDVAAAAATVEFDLADDTPTGTMIVSDDLEDSSPGDTGTAGFQVEIDLTDSVVRKVTFRVVDDPDTETNADTKPQTYTINLNYDSPTNSETAGAAVRLTLQANLRAAVDDEISISLPKFGLPTTIDTDDITINTVNPSDASVSGDKIVLVLADLQPTPDAVLTDDASRLGGNEDVLPTATDHTELATIRISNRAGVTNPTKAGTYGIKIDSDDAEDTEGSDAQQVATVIRSISIKPDKGGSGSEITVTGKGFTDGQATIFIDKLVAAVAAVEADSTTTPPTVAVDAIPEMTDGNGKFDSKDTVLGRADIDDGSFTFTTTKVTTDATINAFDTDDMIADDGEKFAVTASISVDPPELSSAETLTISLMDWNPDDRIRRVTFTGGHEVMIPAEENEDIGDYDAAEKETYAGFVSYTDPSDEKDGTLKVMVPSEVSSGKASVKVYVGSSSAGSAEITVSALTLTVAPAMVVPGEQITIQGTGFNRNDCITSVMVGGISAHSDTSGSDCDEDVKASSGGNIVVSVTVPSTPAVDGADANPIGDGEKTVSVTTFSGRKGEVKITIPEAVITLDPSESRRGSSVSVSATGFPVGDLIQIKYGGTSGRTVAASTTDSAGAANLSFDVPSTATIGAETTVAAVSVGNYAEVTATAKHSTPGATVTVEPSQVVSGGNITITGSNLPASVAVAIMEINGIDVRPVPAPHTEADGSFTATVLVPQLELGNQRVSIRVDESTPTTFVEVVEESDAPVVTDPAEVVVAELSTDPSEVTPGDSLTITGANLSDNQPVVRLNVGGISVLPDDLITEPDGTFTVTVTTPELDAGEQEIEAITGGERVSTTVTVLAVVQTDPADVFASLGDRLVRVWYLERSTQVWSFYDPDPDVAAFNTLTEVSSGQSVSIIISPGENVELQGMTLYQGTNPIPLK